MSVPAAPVLSARNYGSGIVRLSWAPVDGATGYKLYRNTAPTVATTLIASPSGEVYFNAGVTPGTTYNYRLKASNISGDSDYSANVQVVASLSEAPPSSGVGEITGLTNPLLEDLDAAGFGILDLGSTEYSVGAEPDAPDAGTVIVSAVDQNGFPVVEIVGSEGLRRRVVRDGFLVAKCKEVAGVATGQVVYISGASGANEEFKLAQADSADTMPAAGIVQDSADLNDFARIAFVGKVAGLDTSSFTDEGVTLYVSSVTPGAMTETPPASLVQRVGIVTRKHANQGEILVNPPGQTIPAATNVPLIDPVVTDADTAVNAVITALIAAGLMAAA